MNKASFSEKSKQSNTVKFNLQSGLFKVYFFLALILLSRDIFSYNLKGEHSFMEDFADCRISNNAAMEILQRWYDTISFTVMVKKKFFLFK